MQSPKVSIVAMFIGLLLLGGIVGYLIAKSLPISWTEARRLLYSGEVAMIIESHNRGVSMRLKNGQFINIEQPDTVNLVLEVKECGKPCEGIMFISE